MAEFVIDYSRDRHAFNPVIIRAAFTPKPGEDQTPLRLESYVPTPGDIVALDLDPSSTREVAVISARVTRDLHEDGFIARLAAVPTPVTVRVTAVPELTETMSLLSAEPTAVTQTCTIRIDPTERINECDELGARLDRQNERDIRLRQQLEAGSDALKQAYGNEKKMELGLINLESQHFEALALLGIAGAGAALVLGTCAAAAFRFASLMQAEVTLFGSAEVLVGYMEITQGAAWGSMMHIAPKIGPMIARNYAVAAMEAGGATMSAGTVAVLRAKLNAGLTEAHEARDAAIRMRKALFDACNKKRGEIFELLSDIEFTRAAMRGCPDVEREEIPRERVPEVPEEDWAKLI